MHRSAHGPPRRGDRSLDDLPHLTTDTDQRRRKFYRYTAIDDCAEFQSAFHWHVLDQGIGHVYIRSATPRLNGKVERSHRIDAEEFYRLLDGVVIDDSNTFDDKLREWEDYYNYHRPHGGLGGQTPDERLRQKTSAPARA